MFDYSRKPVKWQVGNFSYVTLFSLFWHSGYSRVHPSYPYTILIRFSYSVLLLLCLISSLFCFPEEERRESTKYPVHRLTCEL